MNHPTVTLYRIDKAVQTRTAYWEVQDSYETLEEARPVFDGLKRDNPDSMFRLVKQTEQVISE